MTRRALEDKENPTPLTSDYEPSTAEWARRQAEAHGVFMTASTPTSGTTCGGTDNCNEPADTPATGLAIAGGSASSAADQVVYRSHVNPHNPHLWDTNKNGIG